ncbi:VTT domain-containing protein [Bacillus carboniphilus]|uniref:TVP38/TMEM64 family membrane protein n=1 Tax=Bacillus carboniphilus TaxID=86663 RepID=A0ABN0WBE0_9BACI
MAEWTISIFEQYSNVAIILSIILNTIISILGIIPSVFLTSANIYFWGFWEGTMISFLGEVIGAGVSFLIFRKGGRDLAHEKFGNHPRVRKLLVVQGKEAFFLILSLRLLPFIPSGIITLTAAIGSVSFWVFFVSSSIGKIPALMMEAYSVHEVMEWTVQGKVILAIVGLVIGLYVVKNIKQAKK